jgi:hypothetical protein
MTEMLTWIVNKKLDIMLRCILKHDRSLFNKLFDLSYKSPQVRTNTDTVRKAALDGINNLIIRKARHGNIDIYTLPVILEMSKDDFDAIVTQKFVPNSYNARFVVGCGVVRDFLETKHIPKLLQMIENCVDIKFFGYAWDIVDENHWEMLANFMWEKLYDGKAARRCGNLEVTNSTQMKIAQFVVNKSFDELTNYKNNSGKTISRIEEICKCLFIRYFSSNIQKQFFKEIAAIKKIQREAALFYMSQTLDKKKENFIMIDQLAKIFKASDQSFHSEIIDLAVVSDRSFSLLNLIQSWLEYSLCSPADFKVVKALAVKDSHADIHELYSGLSRKEYFGIFSIEEARELLAQIIKYKALDFGILIWMSSEYPLELRPYEEEIKRYCSSHINERRVFQVIRENLSEKSQKEFLPYFVRVVERESLGNLFHPLLTDDMGIILRIRDAIRKQFCNLSGYRHFTALGALVACYGEQNDLEAGLEVKNPEFLTGFLMNQPNKNLHISPNLLQRILEKSQQCALIYFNSESYYGRERYKKVDFHRAHLFRNNHFNEEIVKTVRIAPNYDDGFTCSDFELLIAQNQTITENQVLPFLHSVRFLEIKNRFIDVWNKFTEEAKLVISETRPFFNVLYRPIQDSLFLDAFNTLGNKDYLLLAFKRVQTDSFLCVNKVILTAHWFFIENFDTEIETGGYLGLFDVASHN